MDDNFGKQPGKLIPRKALAQRQGVCPRTIARRECDDPCFPRPVKINGRNYFWEHEIEVYERGLIRSAMGAR
jgi:hypothetical protein